MRNLRVGLWMAAVVSLVSAVAQAEIRGATPDETKQIEAALKKIPECWRNCDGKGDTPIVVTDADTPTQGRWDPSNGGTMLIDQLALKSKASKQGAKDLADFFCSKDTEMFGVDTNALERTIAHELAHKQHLSCGDGGKESVKKLADQRYFDKRTAVRNDPDYQPTQDALIELIDQAAENWKKANPNAAESKTDAERLARINASMTDEMRAKNCELRKKISGIYRAHGLPVRFEGDDHAADSDKSDLEEDGAEYFAMLVETSLYDPAVFCKSASAEEIDYIQQTYGECLAKFGKKKPGCMDANTKTPTTPTPAKWFRP